MPMRQVDAVHLPSQDRGWIERFLDRDGVRVIVHAVEPNSLRIGQRPGRIEQVAQRHAFPYRVAHQSSVESVTDAHQRRFLLDQIESFQILKPIGDRVLDKTVQFQVPEIDVHARIDDVFGHAIKQVVRRNRLDDATFVLGAVVTERGRAIKFPHQCKAATSDEQAESAQN